MQFSTIYSLNFLLFILASTKPVASAPLQLNSGGIDISEDLGTQAGKSTPKLLADSDAVPECKAPNATTLPTCLANPAIVECTEWVQKATAECVEFTCPANEDTTCITKLQSTVESKPQSELAQCYEAKVKEACSVNAPDVGATLQRVAALKRGIPDSEQTSTHGHEKECPETPGPKASDGDIQKVPTITNDAPHVGTPDKKFPDIKAPKTQRVPLEARGLLEKLPKLPLDPLGGKKGSN